MQTSAENVFVLSILIGSLLIGACGGSEKEDDGPEDVDSGIVVSDAGVTENDASVAENDAGIIENDAGTEDEPPVYISIPAGSFVLSHGTALYNEGDTVTLSAFALKKTPVTVAEFEKCVAAGKCSSKNYKTVSDLNYCNYNRGADWKKHPMNCIDLDGAKEYCEWIGGRVPTEEEWEYAATHNGTKHLDTTYPWGNDAPTHCATAQYYDSSYCQGNAAATLSNNTYKGTSDVSLHSPAGDSPLGLVDMSGNVWEWTTSLYIDGGLPYALKGGSWTTDLGLAIAGRISILSWNQYNDNGVRCAK